MCRFPIPKELVDVLQRAARHAQGWDLIREAYLETAAIMLGVHPFVLEAARSFLATPEGGRCIADTASDAGGPLPAVSSFGEESEEARTLILEAQQRAEGLDLLRSGPVDEVSAAFGVHPYTILRARGALERYPYQRPG